MFVVTCFDITSLKNIRVVNACLPLDALALLLIKKSYWFGCFPNAVLSFDRYVVGFQSEDCWR